MGARRFTDQQEKEIVREYRAGSTASEIGERRNASCETILSILKRRNVRRRRPGPPKKINSQQRRQIAKRYQSGSTLQEIGVQYGIGGTTVANTLDDANVSRRPPGRKASGNKRPGRPRKLTEQQEREIVRDYRAGEPIAELAEKTGCHRSTVCRILDRHHISRERYAGYREDARRPAYFSRSAFDDVFPEEDDVFPEEDVGYF